MTTYQFMRIVEIRTKIVSVSSFTIGTLFAVYRDAGFDPLVCCLMLAAVLCVDMGTTAFNTFYDYMKGVDAADHNREADKVLVHQGVAPGVALLVSLGFFFGAVVLGLVIGIMTNLWVIVVGALSMVVGFVYNGGPHPLSRTPIGEVFAGAFLGGVVLVLSYYVHALRVDASVVPASIPSTLFIASILTTNNTCDVRGDAEAGRRTLSVLLGSRVSRWLIYAQGAAAYGFVAVLTARGVFPRIAWVAVGLGSAYSLYTYVRMHRRGYSHETKGPSMAAILKAFAVFTLLLSSALAVGAVPR